MHHSPTPDLKYRPAAQARPLSLPCFALRADPAIVYLLKAYSRTRTK
jgi:hypothetical protein